MYFVYIFLLRTGEFYKGLTNNIERRINQHKDGQVLATRNKLPFELIHVEIVKTRIEARTLEKYFKSGYGRENIKEIADEMMI